MRPGQLEGGLLRAMVAHARATYPDECCGFLVAERDPEAPTASRHIVAVEPAPNDFEGERRRRFLLRPEELAAAEQRQEGTGRVVAGFYHSHPDHPARPSTYDRDHAWPWYTYIVLGVTSSGFEGAGAFELDADRGEFGEVPLAAEELAPPAAPVVKG